MRNELVKMKVDLACTHCGVHRIVAIIHKPFPEHVEVLQIEKGDLNAGFSRLYDCGKPIESDKKDLIYLFTEYLKWVRPIVPLVRLAILRCQAMPHDRSREFFERVPYETFFQALEQLILENEVQPSMFRGCETVWHIGKPPNTYRSPIIESFFEQFTKDESTNEDHLRGAMPVMFAYYHPDEPKPLIQAIHQQLRNLDEERREAVRYLYFYRLTINMHLDLEIAKRFGLDFPEYEAMRQSISIEPTGYNRYEEVNHADSVDHEPESELTERA